jgi:hypothetical protein
MHDLILREFAPGCSNNAWFSAGPCRGIRITHSLSSRAKKIVRKSGRSSQSRDLLLIQTKAGPSTRLRIVAADPLLGRDDSLYLTVRNRS